MAPDLNSVFLNTLTGSGYGNGAVGSDPALNAFSRTIGQNDYWKQAAAPIGAAKFNTSTWSPLTTGLVSGAQGFLSALLSGYGSNQEASQLDAVRQVLPQIRAGEDVPLPDGVNPEAYQGLKLSAAQDLFSSKQKIKDAVTQSLAEKGVAINADGTLDTSGLSAIKNAEDQAKVDAAGNKPLTRAQLGAAQDLAKTIGGIATLNSLDQKISGLEGDNSYLGGVQRYGESLLFPNSNSARYQDKVLPAAGEQLSKAFTGTGAAENVKRLITQLGLGFGADKDTLYTGTAAARQDAINTAAGLLDGLAAQVPDDKPLKVLGGQTLADMRLKLDQAKTKTLLDDSFITPTTSTSAATSVVPSAPDLAAAKADADVLRARGMDPKTIAATLRAKYGGN